MIPIAMASLFVVGCIMINILQRWPTEVTIGLCWIFAGVCCLIISELATNHKPRLYADASTRTMLNARASYGVSGFNQNGPTQVRTSPPYKVPVVFQD
jgi:TM2 domain-containing membrane protein YozV